MMRSWSRGGAAAASWAAEAAVDLEGGLGVDPV